MPYVPKPKPCYLDEMIKHHIYNGRQVYIFWTRGA